MAFQMQSQHPTRRYCQCRLTKEFLWYSARRSAFGDNKWGAYPFSVTLSLSENKLTCAFFSHSTIRLVTKGRNSLVTSQRPLICVRQSFRSFLQALYSFPALPFSLPTVNYSCTICKYDLEYRVELCATPQQNQSKRDIAACTFACSRSIDQMTNNSCTSISTQTA